MAKRVDHEVKDEHAVFHAAYQNPSGSYFIEARVCGRVVIDGKEYEVDRVVRIALKKPSKQGD